MKDQITFGTVKMFNGQYGFIKSISGDVFFHIKDVKDSIGLGIGSRVSFVTVNSKRKPGCLQAIKVELMPEAVSPIKEIESPRYIGRIEWYSEKGFGNIRGNRKNYFFHVSSFTLKPDFVNPNDVVLYNLKPSLKSATGSEEASDIVFLKEIDRIKVIGYESIFKFVKNVVEKDIKLLNVNSSWCIEMFNLLNSEEALELLNIITEVLLVKPIKNKNSHLPLIKLIGYRINNSQEYGSEIGYVANNPQVFPEKYFDIIPKFINRASYGRKTYESSSSFGLLVETVKCIINHSIPLSELTLKNHFTQTKILDIRNLIKNLSTFKQIKLIIDRYSKSTLYSDLFRLIAGDLSEIKEIIIHSSTEEKGVLLFEINELDGESLKLILIDLFDSLNTSIKLKLWVHGISEFFDFNTYCFYYFTLSPPEKSIFNKKAKLIMVEEIKSSMLKQREPWRLVDFDEEFQIYTASWKSIWFHNQYITFELGA